MDLTILIAIQNAMQSTFCDYLFRFLTSLGNVGFVWIGFTLFFLIKKETRKIGMIMALAFIIDVISVNLLIKPLFLRPRPYTVYPVTLLIPEPRGSSFPSGHASLSFAVAFAYFLNRKDKLRWVLLALAFGIAFSRLYLFVHYPSDVLVGALLGIFVAWLSTKLILYFTNAGYLKRLGLERDNDDELPK